MRHVFIFCLCAILSGLGAAPSQAADQTPPPPQPLKTITAPQVPELETGTDLTSKKAIKEQAGLKLLWNGENVPPPCFNSLVMGEVPLQSVTLPGCAQDPTLQVTKTYTHEGQIISNYRYKDGEPDEPDLSIMYHVVGNTTDGVAVEVSSYTGGSGRFTGLNIVSVSGDTLTLVKSLGGGDRCNSGVADAEIKSGQLVYGFYLTPADFAMLAFGDDQGLVAYEDLEASASSCFGIARYREGKLIEVELLPKAVTASDPEWTARYALQTCFNQKLKGQADNKAILPASDFKTFVQDFLNSCRKA